MNWQIEHMHERYQERMREITHLRLVYVKGELEVGTGGKTLAWLGHWMVAAGEQLQAHAAPRA